MRTTLPERLIDDLLSRIQAAVGDRFFDNYKGSDPAVFRDEWAHALSDLKKHELERGLRELANAKFPPSLGEFRVMCRPCLDPEWAFHHAHLCLLERDKGEVGNWSHPAEWRAASVMSLEIRRGDYGACKGRWRVLLERELAAGWGEMPPVPPQRLSNGEVTRPPTAEERQRIKEFQARVRESALDRARREAEELRRDGFTAREISLGHTQDGVL